MPPKSLFLVDDFIDLSSFVEKLRTLRAPISKCLWEQFSVSTQDVLTSTTSTPKEQKLALVEALNNILKGVLIYETARFAGVELSPETLALKSQNPRGIDLIRLNRLLLEDAYPREIAKSEKLKIFLSHSTKYGELAKSLKVSLQTLEKETLLDIKLSEEMTGATNWWNWIEENVRTADVFLFLYPNARMEMGWCNYELGRFYDGGRNIVCIKNTDIPEPPPTFQPYQAYNADESGFAKFIKELFVVGTLSRGRPVNPLVEKIGSEFYDRATSVKTQLTKQFTEARVQEQFYERRITISISYDDTRQLDPERSIVQGNAEGLNLLGLDELQRSNGLRFDSCLVRLLSGPRNWKERFSP